MFRGDVDALRAGDSRNLEEFEDPSNVDYSQVDFKICK